MADVTRGLTPEQVIASRVANGVNVLTPPPKVHWWKLYLEKFDDPIIRILMIAAGIAITVGVIDGKYAEGVGILVAIFLATFLAFWNEHRAAREFDLLSTTDDELPVKILRHGGYIHGPRKDVVVGDLVFVEVGEEVPADGLLDEAVGLEVNESKLTGEAVAAEKTVGEKLYRGTTVVDGYGLMVIEVVGDQTEIGKTLRESMIAHEGMTPLNRQLAKLSQIIGVVGFGIALVVFVALVSRGAIMGSLVFAKSELFVLTAIAVTGLVSLVNIWLPIVYDAFEILGFAKIPPGWLGGKSRPVSLVAGLVIGVILMAVGVLVDVIPSSPGEWLSSDHTRELLRNFMIAVTIIVVAVPEGLAMSVTLSIAYSIRKMTITNTLVRRMAACETIGAATVICSDKTGTLTRNEMRVAEVWVAASSTQTLSLPTELRAKLIEAIAANSTSQLTREKGQDAKAIGNPTEGALLLWLDANGVDYTQAREAFQIQTQWTFNTERKYMATLGPMFHLKGAPEIVLAGCTSIQTSTGVEPLTEPQRSALQEQMKLYQFRGLRTLALAYRSEPMNGNDDVEALAHELTWLALVAIADPVRPEVPEAIRACQVAGVEVKIVTGDNEETASEIARQIGMPPNAKTMTGVEFAGLTDEDAHNQIGGLAILARARPADKLRLVRLLKMRGEVVAVTGDGVNDGPALNFADVGLAMGKTGTAVAREASDIILLDDSFSSIVSAIRWGRSLYENIQRFILFQLTINVVALGMAILGPFVGYELPLTVMQMLWVNLIMDTFAALALATEPPHDGVMSRPPRPPSQFIVTPAMARTIFGTGLVFLAVLVAFMVFWPTKEELDATDAPSRSGTILFTSFVLLQFWNLFNAKAMGRTDSVFSTLGNNKSFLAIAAAILLGQILLVQLGGVVFRTVPLSIIDWLLLMVSTSVVLGIGELIRLGRRREAREKSVAEA